MKPGLMPMQGRQMTISPMLQKSLHLLQLNAVEFTQAINAVLDSNPLLETDGDEPLSPDVDEAVPEPVAAVAEAADDDGDAERTTEYDAPVTQEPWGAAPSGASGAASSSSSSGPSESDWTANVADADTFRDRLSMQILERQLSVREQQGAMAIVESLDDRGYLTESLDDLVDQFDRVGISLTVEELRHAHAVVRSLDPLGVGATSTVDCLRMQLDALHTQEAAYELASRVLSEHLEDLGHGNFRQMAAELGCSNEALQAAVTLIQALDPIPGRRFSVDRINYVVPDITVRRIGDKWTALPAGSSLPQIRVNETYAQILSEHQSGDSEVLKEKLREARWLLRSIDQRNRTILAVGQAIVDRQQGYFEYGDIALEPMTLTDIAEEIGAHQSTVSRVVTSKYLVYPGGLRPMKMFFSSHVQTNAGDACSASAVKAMIKRLVQEESADDPLSDHKLAELLAARGIKVARRTVSKYRGALGIQSFQLRRRDVPVT